MFWMRFGAHHRAVLVVALATGGVPPAVAQDTTLPETAPLSVEHDAVTCMVAGEHPQIEAGLVPETSVESGRVLFHSSLGTDFYYVEMQSVAGRFVGTLPKPRLDAGPVTYYVEGLGFGYTQAQTAETRSTVVAGESECEGKVAAYVPGDAPVTVYSLTGSTAAPPGFAGVGSVVVTGAGTAAPAAAAAATTAATTAGTGSFLTSTGGILLMGAAAVGVATAIIVTRDEDPPVSPSR